MLDIETDAEEAYNDGIREGKMQGIAQCSQIIDKLLAEEKK